LPLSTEIDAGGIPATVQARLVYPTPASGPVNLQVE
jgi:hypothetical protein